ncbi:MAG: hypothetical protein CVU03_02570 [Bacteroidetes bacterium HGW-Bacteroidetes-2]|nr:MAG: hypothetical protein CVU13_05745 [Bacteroidetes bacterium HGW-Bacteroidetes-8]PKP26775.1 MAG: hypothetical protein CVU03_02570 [Bacteroidetes bacterium HGW-Bacteroidetes-2]
MKNSCYFLVIFILFCSSLVAQKKDTLQVVITNEELLTKTIIKEPYDPLAPSRAAFYSAVIPGLGQAYNKKYWKIPIIYAGIGTSIYFYVNRNQEYNRFRDAYKRRLAGFTDDEFQGIANETLIRAQQREKRNKDVSIAVAVGFYLLNIVDANVDAHLKQYNVSEDLSFQPNVEFNALNATTNYGFSLTYQLK